MNLIEDEYHFLLVCPHYTNIRRKYLPRYYCRWPNLHKFSTLMSSKSERILTRLCKYIHFAEKRRIQINDDVN